MKYIPGLVPPEHKVLPEYFNEAQTKPSAGRKAANVLRLLAALALFIAGLVVIYHPLLTLLIALIGFVLLPQGKAWLEKTGRFRLTASITAGAAAIVALTLIPLFVFYSHADAVAAAALKLQEQKQQAADLAAAEKRRQQGDNLQAYLNIADSLSNKGKFDEASHKLGQAREFALNDSGRAVIASAENGLQETQAITQAKNGNYAAALPKLTALIDAGKGGSTTRYYRAVCYVHAGIILDAVNDLKLILGTGNGEADKLYDRINPIVKHITGYVTRCRDGSTSYAKGRGACSHHGGVANWNDPIYETSRKYE